MFIDRRKVLAGLELGLSALGIGMMPRLARSQEDPSAALYPAKRNEAFQLDRELTPESVNSNYNNFYEFGSHKEIADAVQALQTRPWEIRIDGEVDKAQTIAIDDLIKTMPLGERLYLHRCVEAWSMTVPWSGFSMKSLIDFAFVVTGAYGKPLAKQFGAPLRLAMPLKFGFKSIKSIKRISFTSERPVSFLENIAAMEYGFWANVNPEVPHPR